MLQARGEAAPGPGAIGAGALGVTRREHVPVLDGLRAAAILLVLWAHMPWRHFPALLQPTTYGIQPGFMGVDLFFVLSGFLITRILLHDKATGKRLRGFLYRRALRIFPIYYLAILFFAIVDPGPQLWWCATYLWNYRCALVPEVDHSLGHSWSLCVEEHYYLVWPLVVYWLPARWSRAVAMVVIPSGVIVTAVVMAMFKQERPVEYARYFHEQPEAYFYLLTNFRVISLALGSGVAFVETWLRAQPTRCFVAAMGVGVLLLPVASLGVLDVGAYRQVGKLVVIALLSLGALLASLGVQGLGGWWTWPLDNPLTRFIGKISYGLYLYHYGIFKAMGVHSTAPGEPFERPWLAAVAAGLSIAAATLSYYAIERPILRFKDRVA